ncbi:solute carrier family 22 member 18 isoform X7 [Hippopotamus amphibius kiboko]|uniref:solute carrier family 22 member 18 isoform X7 n=1 Tax=Hippopotamus amphibius kiboko TaxID=575201 RepID=UPI0025944C30|nr:solute carrier family 22 member 18 isoform X7 [Hippopotamus amphibius kiboko]
MSRISLGGGGAHLGGPGHPERAGARVQPRKGPTGAHPRSALLTATVPKLTPAKGLPPTPAQDAGSWGPQGRGPVPQGDGHSGPVLGHAAHLRTGSPGVHLPLHAVLHYAAAQMVITDLSPPAERPAALGRLGLCFGVGVIFGSLLGGTLSSACGPQEETMTVRGASPQCLCPQVTRAAWSWRSRPAHAAQRGQAAREPSVPWRIAARPRPLPQPSWDSASWLPPPPTLRGRQDPYAVSTARGSGRIQCPVIMALVANLLGAALSFTCIPASTKGASAHAQASLPGKPKASVFDLKAITQLLLQPGVLPVFLVKVICSLPSGLFMVMFSIISMDFFQLEASQAGYLMSFFGILQMVIQGLVIGRLSSHFSEDALLRASVLVFSVVGLAMALMANVFHFCLLMPGLVFSLCALNVVTDSMLTKAVSASDTGTMLGLCASVQPLTRTLGPTLGGLLYRHFGVPVFGHVQFVVNFVVFLVLWRQPTPPKMDKAR